METQATVSKGTWQIMKPNVPVFLQVMKHKVIDWDFNFFLSSDLPFIG